MNLADSNRIQDTRLPGRGHPGTDSAAMGVHLAVAHRNDMQNVLGRNAGCARTTLVFAVATVNNCDWFCSQSKRIRYATGSTCITDTSSGVTHRLIPSEDLTHAPRPEACVFSPEGKRIAYVRPVTAQGQTWNQVFVLTLEGTDS